MKKNLKSIMMAVAALLSLTMTSCQEDELIAMTLDGNWKGNMYVSYQINGRGDYYEASYSEVCFLRNPSKFASGDGYWIDYYNDYRRYGWERNYIANHINWDVTFECITIHFIEDNYTNALDTLRCAMEQDKDSIWCILLHPIGAVITGEAIGSISTPPRTTWE